MGKRIEENLGCGQIGLSKGAPVTQSMSLFTHEAAYSIHHLVVSIRRQNNSKGRVKPQGDS